MRFSYIGDPLSALGFSLIGATLYSPPLEPAAVIADLAAAREHSELILIENGHAALVAEHITSLLRSEPLPPIIAVPCLHRDDALFTRAVERARLVLGVS